MVIQVQLGVFVKDYLGEITKTRETCLGCWTLKVLTSNTCIVHSGERLKSLRNALPGRPSQYDIAVLMGVTPQAVGLWEKGAKPTSDNVELLDKVLNAQGEVLQLFGQVPRQATQLDALTAEVAELRRLADLSRLGEIRDEMEALHQSFAALQTEVFAMRDAKRRPRRADGRNEAAL